MKKNILLLLLFLTQSATFGQYINYKFYEDFLTKYVSKEGNVDYDAIYENKKDLTMIIDRFKSIEVYDNWSKNQKLSYWINVYNVYSIKLIIDHFPINSIKDIYGSFDLRFIPYQKQLISLNYIEKEILSKTLDERIHFAINCASISCPSLNRKPFYGDILDEQLEQAAKVFINDMTKNNISRKEIKLSKIFEWFSDHFLQNNTSIISYINKYSTVKIKEQATISYLEYNWSLNSQMKFNNKEFLAASN
ncbi:DUF547 domain-containing protein [Flavobacterium sediminilitoris]|uniref:DUF547 domain-containing protein n=1 Tax=Flavobacterium sediminilitoris TaxID=2024526 RepID=A0ABY4HIS2_9FLAO|nr:MULTISPECIES: DUF547 domain-containing protein [Flavobacterium]UOX32726.1 DUF547 domain-containing protein [Flavobacterium sediminilitoris]